MAAKGEVDLIIRAKNEATKNVDAINKSLKALSDQQTIVGDTAGKTDDQLSRLGLELAKLQTNAQNLKALSTVGEVLDKAAAAMERQRVAAAESAAELARVEARQKEVGDQSQAMATALKTASTELKSQDAAFKSTKSSISAYSKEATTLAGEEKSLTAQLGTAAATLVKRQAALDDAAKKQAELTNAIASSEKVTKAQQNSLDAANRTLERRQKAVADTVAKEAGLRDQLTQVQKAQGDVTAAILNGNAALVQQTARVNEAQGAVSKIKVQADSLAKAERDIVKDVDAATAAVQKQASTLGQAESEYAQVQAAATSARAAVAGSATASKDAGTAAGAAAVQVATFAARLAVLAGASNGKTSNPIAIDPKAINEAEGALRALGVTIAAAGNDAAKSSVSAKDMTTALKGVGTAAASLQTVSTAIGAQQQAVDGARAAWKAAQDEVQRLALAIKAADEPSASLAAAFGKAQGAARLAKDEFLKQTAAADKIATSFQAAGMGTGTLESAQSALAPKIRAANDLLAKGQSVATQFGSAMKNAAAGASDAEPKMNRLATALGAIVGASNKLASATNPLRSFRNELVQLVAAGAGLYAIKEQLTSVWEAGSNLAANQAKFSTAFGSIAEGNKELAYARDVALNLKLPIDSLTKSYADLALSAKGTTMEGEGARKVFVAFAQTARVNQTSSASLEGVFTALTQIMSKGKVQAEELRQQLGDRLPGAMQLMAQGIGVPVEKLDQMMQKGELTRTALLNMAAAASGRVAPALAAALDSPAAKLQDFQNRILVFKETVAGSGFLDAIADAFDRMAKALSTPEAIQAAKDLGAALADIVKWVTELISGGGLDTIASSLKALGIAWVGIQITSLITGLYGFATAIGVTAAAALGLDVAMAPVLIGLGLLGAAVATVVGAFALWKLAEWCYDNFPAFAEGVMGIKAAALNAWDGILEFWELTAAKLKTSFTRVTAGLADIWYGMLNQILGSFPELTKMVGMGDYAGAIAKKAAEAAATVANGEKDLQTTLDGIRSTYAAKEDQRQKDLQENITKYYSDRIKAEKTAAGAIDPSKVRGGKPIGATNGATGAGTETITAPAYVVDDTKAKEAAAKKAAAARVSLEKSVADQMYGIRAQLEKKSAATTDEMVAAVPAKYAALYAKLTALGKDKNSEEWKDVDALVAQEQQIIRNTQAKKADTAAAKLGRQAETAENQKQKELMETVNALMQSRKNIQEQLKRAQDDGDTDAVNTLKTNLAEVTTKATEAIAKAREYWTAFGGPEADAALAKLDAQALALTKVKKEGILTSQTIASAFTGSISSAADGFIDSIAEAGLSFDSLGDAFRNFAVDFLKQIAKMILQQAIFNALSAALGGASSGATASSVGGLIGAALSHNGSVAGSANQSRSNVNPAVFANAVKYHGGGVAGLKSNEIPTILEAGETVRTQQQEKALGDKMNASGGGAAAPQTTNIINTIDTESFFAAANSSPTFQKTLLNLIRANKSSVKSIIG